MKRKRSVNEGGHIKNASKQALAAQLVLVCHSCEQSRNFIVSEFHTVPNEGPPEE